MNYINKRLNLTAEPANSLGDHYKVMIGGGCFNFNLIHKSLIEGSADWEQQPDWVITGFRFIGSKTSVYVLGDDGRYRGECPQFGVAASVDKMIENKNFEIFSVRRSDGVEFKVGDKVTTPGWGDFVIYKFEIEKNEIIVKEAENIIRSFYDMQPAPTVLFTTHDGVDIKDGETRLFWVTSLFEIEDCFAADPLIKVANIKTFYTKKAAENYIAEHKPLYSLADIRKAWDEIDFISYTELIEQLKQVK